MLQEKRLTMEELSVMMEDILHLQTSEERIFVNIIIPACKTIARRMAKGTYTEEFANKTLHKALKSQLQLYASESKGIVSWDDQLPKEDQNILVKEMLRDYRLMIKAYAADFKN